MSPVAHAWQLPKFMKNFANFFECVGCVGCEYLTQSKPSVVTLENQISCGVQKQIHYIAVVVVVVLCSFFLWFCCLEGVLIVCYHVESWRPLSWNRINSDSVSENFFFICECLKRLRCSRAHFTDFSSRRKQAWHHICVRFHFLDSKSSIIDISLELNRKAKKKKNVC